MPKKTKPATKAKSTQSSHNTIFSPEGLKDFLSFFEKVDIAEVEISEGDKSLVVSKSSRMHAAVLPQQTYMQTAPAAMSAAPTMAAPAASPATAPTAAAAAPAPKQSNLLEITSPIVGTFYRSPDPKQPAFVEVGTAITVGKTVCTIEAMKVFNEIKAEISGIVREVCVQNEQPVEFGQVLFRVEAQ